MKIKGKPDVSKFLDAGAVSEAPAKAKSEPAKASAKKTGRKGKAKLIYFPDHVFEALKDRAYAEYKKTGKRVAESDIILEAVEKHLGIH